ncbi:MAG: aldo/keto reductase [Meiothermus sp.]|nr:aldo/keto reductase [Meiothermus sp.]
MKYGSVEGLSKPVSRLVLGVDSQDNLETAAPLFDVFLSRGGNAFDTAWVYKSGASEAVFGDWMSRSRLRDQVVLIGKGAHTPRCTPEDLSLQLAESLERLRTDHLDVYLMHRDNPQVPVGEFVDVLNRHFRAGQMRVFGGSNWSLERLQAASAYASKHGLEPFGAVSNQFSLAQMLEPSWAGCLGTDQALRAWLTQTQTPLFPWSSQARGFFVRADPADRADEELVRCWYSPANFARLERAQELARAKGLEPIQIALAYVLHQPFPTFPLVGCRSGAELDSSLGALEVALTPQKVRWLEAGSALE